MAMKVHFDDDYPFVIFLDCFNLVVGKYFVPYWRVCLILIPAIYLFPWWHFFSTTSIHDCEIRIHLLGNYLFTHLVDELST